MDILNILQLDCDSKQRNINLRIDLTNNPLLCECCMAWLKTYEYNNLTKVSVLKDPFYCRLHKSIMWDEVTPDYFSYCAGLCRDLNISEMTKNFYFGSI